MHGVYVQCRGCRGRVYLRLKELTKAACFLRLASRALSRWLPRAMSQVVVEPSWGSDSNILSRDDWIGDANGVA